MRICRTLLTVQLVVLMSPGFAVVGGDFASPGLAVDVVRPASVGGTHAPTIGTLARR